MQRYEVIRTLGEGTFGKVLLVKEKGKGELLALKRMAKGPLIELKQVDHVFNEVRVLNLVNHPFLVNGKGHFQDNRYFCVLLEHVEGGELFAYLRRRGNLQRTQAMQFAGQVVLAFDYLHSKRIIFRDLKPENILFQRNGYLKITDFGFAKIVPDRTFTICGTPEYLAPQIIQNVGHGLPVDWWTLGVLLYELLAGIDPFSDEDTMMIYQNILRCRIRFPKSVDKEARSLIKHLLVLDLSKRYGNTSGGSQPIKEHRFFQGLDWKALQHMEIPMQYKPSSSALTPTSIETDNSPKIPEKDDPFMRFVL